MINCKETNFSRLRYKVGDMVEDLKASAGDPGSIITEDDITDDNLYIFGIYQLIAPYLLKLTIDEALDMIYDERYKLPKPETLTREAKRHGLRFKAHPSRWNTTYYVNEAFVYDPYLTAKLDINKLLEYVYEMILYAMEVDYSDVTFGDLLLMEDLPSIDTVIRTARDIRRKGI